MDMINLSGRQLMKKEEKEEYLGILFQVKQLDENVFKLRAKKSLVGELVKRRKNTYFITEEQNYYASFDEAFSNSSKKEIVYFYTFLKEVEEQLAVIGIDALCNAYFEEMNKYEYLVITGDVNTTPYVLAVPKNEIITNESYIDEILKDGKHFSEFVLNSLNDIINEKEFEKSLQMIRDLLETYESIVIKSEATYIKEFASIMASNCEKLLKDRSIESQKESILSYLFDLKKTLVKIKKQYDLDHPKQEQETVEIEEEEVEIPLDIVGMKEFLDSRIIGQEQAKRDVISTIIMNKLAEDKYGRNHCLLVGPTGCGKTLILETISEYLSLPITIVDSTQLTAAGYVGGKIEDILLNLYTKANENIDLAEEGIIVFDELDKKGSKNNSDISQKAVLNALLPLMSGTTYDITIGNEFEKRTITFDTSHLTIFGCGSFMEALEKKEIAEKEKNPERRIGILNQNTTEQEKIKTSQKSKLTIEDIHKYGDFPMEVIGRFTNIVTLDELSKDVLKEILLTSSVSPLLLEQQKLAKIEVFLDYTDEFIDAVINDAIKKKTGARSLKATIESAVKNARWDALYSGKKEIILTPENILGEDGYSLVKKIEYK